MLVTRKLHIIAVLLFVASTIATGCSSDESVPAGKASSPTEAYKMLYTAVKAKKPDDIRMMLSKDSVKFAEGVSSQMKKPFNEQIRNGFTRTTFAAKMPEIRDERIKGNFGAVEVYNSRDKKWEDLPFILEDGGWKLAVGNVFAGTWKSPGVSRSTRERENSNAVHGNNMVPYGNVNSNVNIDTVNRRPVVPKPGQMPPMMRPPANNSQ